jgi:hypothetical protein
MYDHPSPAEKELPLIQRRSVMKLVLSLLIAFAVWFPTFAFAEGAGGTYRGIAQIYYTVIWVVLCYGLNDTFGRKAFYVGAPILAIGIYLLLPPG